MKLAELARRSSDRSFVHDALPGRIVFGAGSRTRLADEFALLGAQRILVIVTPSLEAVADELAAPLQARAVGRFTDVRGHVPTTIAARARDLADELGADALLSIGGGSSTGTAKAVALTSGLPVVAVPTTHAGSEVTPVWGLTENGRKTTGTDPRVLPRVVVYDPELTTGLPLDVSAASRGALRRCAVGVPPQSDLGPRRR